MSDLDLARRAHEGTSFVPEERARHDLAARDDALAGFRQGLDNLAETDEQRTLLDREWERFREGYLKRWRAWLSARGRCLSPMITGPARFPVAQNEKRFSSERNRWDELDSFQKRARAAIARKINAAKTDDQRTEEEFQRLKAKATRALATIKGVKAGALHYDASLFRSNAAGMIKRSDNPKAVRRVLEWIRDEAQPAAGVELFAKRNAVWKLLDAPEPSEPERTGVSGVAQGEGWEVVVDYDEDRVQIRFDAIPPDGLRAALKGEGWRWSRRNGAWQRKATANAEASALRILGASV